MTTTLKDTIATLAAGDEIDAGGYLKLRSNCEVASQAVNEDSSTQLASGCNQ